MNPLFRRVSAVIASSALVVSGATLLSSPAQAATDPRPAGIGADWLADQLVGGVQLSSFGSADVGLTIDTALALDEVGGHPADLTAIAAGVRPKIVETGKDLNGDPNYGYAQSDEFSFPAGVLVKAGARYAAGFAKSLYFAQTTGIADIPAWAGTDLAAGLEDLVTDAGASAGRLHDDSSFGDYVNTITQGYAANALDEAGSAQAGAALDFLLKQQCSAGYFRLKLTKNKSASDQTCDGGRSSGDSPADPDVTSEVTRLLLPLMSNPGVARRVGKAEAWLLNQQRPDGSFGGGTSTAASNANSTGLAGWVLMQLDDEEAATRAASWIRQHQADELAGCVNGLTPQTGAIGYNDAAVAAGVKKFETSARPQWVRATSQALPVLQLAPESTPALAITSPKAYVKAGAGADFSVAGVVPGDKVCMTGFGAPTRVAAGANGVAKVVLKAPAGTADRTVTVTGRSGTPKAATVKVLGSKKLGVATAAAKVKRGKTVRVTVTGLAATENVTLRLRGKVVATGKATAAGTFVKKVKVGTRTGKATILATGQFSDIRHGTKVIKVVR